MKKSTFLKVFLTGLLVIQSFFVAAQSPVISSLNSTVLTTGGTLVISGQNFGANSSSNLVWVGEILASISSASSTSIQITVPSGASGGKVKVLNKTTGLYAYASSEVAINKNGNAASISEKFFEKTTLTSSTTPSAPSAAAWNVAVHPGTKGDFNNDGKIDFVKVDYNNARVVVFENGTTAGSSFGASDFSSQNFTVNAYPINVATGDLNGDGLIDIVTTHNSTTVSILLNTSTSSTISFSSYQSVTLNNSSIIQIGDINKDGKEDLLTSTRGSSSLNVYLNNTTPLSSSPSFATVSQISTSASINDIELADLDQDGDLEVILPGPYNGVMLQILDNTSSGSAFAYNSLTLPNTHGKGGWSVKAADLNNDGDLDILLGVSSGIVIIENGYSSGSLVSSNFSNSFYFNSAGYNYVWQSDVADFDGNGTIDIITGDFNGGSAIRLIENETASGGSIVSTNFDNTKYLTSADSYCGIVVADINNDGKQDYIGFDRTKIHLGRNFHGDPLNFYPQYATSLDYHGRWFLDEGVYSVGGFGTSAFGFTSATFNLKGFNTTYTAYSDMQIDGNLKFYDGPFSCRNLYVKGSIIDASASSYIKTASLTWLLKQDVDANATKTFPVGETSYHPTVITNNSTADSYEVMVVDDVANDGTSPYSSYQRSKNVVQKLWKINKTSTNVSTTIQFNWNSTDNTNGIVQTPALFTYDATASEWVQVTSGVSVSGTTLTLSNYTGSLSNALFAVGDEDYAFATPRVDITNNMTALTTCQGGSSTPQSFVIDGIALDYDLVLYPPSGFEVSESPSSGYSSSSITLTRTNGNILNKTVYVRLRYNNYGPWSGNLRYRSYPIDRSDIALSGSVVQVPSVNNETVTVLSGSTFNHTPTVTNGVSNVNYSWTANTNTNVIGETSSTSASTSISQTLTLSGSASETVTYTVTPSSSCGSGSTFTLTATVLPVPDLTSMSKSSAYLSEEITLTGTTLSNISSVTVGGQSATFTINSSTEIVFEVPQNSTGSIVVSDGTSTATLNGFTYLPTTVASIVPDATTEGITWYDLMFGSNWDPLDDQQAVAETDLVGDANNVLTQVGASKMIIGGQALDDYYYFRTRMGEADPKTSIYLGLDLDGDNIADVFVEANNKAQTPYVAYHLSDPSKSGISPSQTGWLNSTNNTNVELQLTGSQSQITRYTTGVDMENSNQSDDDDWVEWAFSEESLKSFASSALSLNIDGNSAIALFCFTSTSQTANGDIAGVDDNTADLTDSWANLGIVIYGSLNSVSSGTIITPTVTSLSTTNPTPTISGFWGGDLGGSDALTIIFNGVTYTSASPEMSILNNAWSIALTSSNALVTSGAYDVQATVTRGSTTVTDNTSNEITFTADAVAPVVLTQDITLPLNVNGSASISTADIDNGTTDNSGSFTLSLDLTSFSCADLGTNTVTLTATDAVGNTSSATATVTVEDNLDPTITAPSGVTVNVDAGACSTALTNVTLGSPTTSDNCSVGSTTNDAPTSFPLGNTTVTWTVTDGSGNTATATQVVTVVDNIDPTITAPSAVTVNVDAGACSTDASNVTLGTPTTSDNCSVASTSNDAPTSFPLGNTTVTWTVTDGSGNTATATQVVTVVDNIDPTITAPAAVTVNAATGTCSIAASNVTLGTPNTSDNCSVASTSNDAPSTYSVGTTTVTWTVTDGSGNTATATQVVTVVENIDPTITAPSAVTVNVDAGACSTAASNVTLGTPTTSDNCSVASTSNDAPTSFPLGNTTVTWTVTDGSGNTATATQVVTVVDNINPTITAPSAVTVNVDAGTCGTALTNVTLGTPTTSDNCSVASATNDAPTSFPLGNTTVTWTVTDGSGNTATATQVVTVVDNIDPTITAPSAVTVNVDAGACSTAVSNVTLGTPTISDNCSVASTSNDAPTSFPLGNTTVTWTVTDGSGNTATATQVVTVVDNIDPVAVAQNVTVSLDANGTASITTADVDNGSSDNCSFTLALDVTSFGCDDLGANTVTLTATDGRGNTNSATATVTVVDNSAPSVVTQDITVALDASGSASITTADIDNGSSDNCSYTLALDITSFDCDDLGANVVTLTGTDGSGNTNSATATVTVVDNLAPVAVAQNVTVSLDANGAASITTADIDNGSSDNCSYTLALDVNSFTCSDLGANTVTLTATDGSGNTHSATATVTVEDNIDPTITAPSVVTVNVDAGACSTALTNVTLGTPTTADNCSVASATNDAPTSFPLGNTTVTWTVTDGSGNTATAIQLVTVVDNIDPTITAPSAVTVNVDADSCSTSASNITLGTPTTSDNCSVASTTNDAPASFPLGSTTVTWTVMDGSGNTATATQEVTVEDNIDPVLSCPSNMVVYGAADSTLTSVSWTAATATDNCTIDTVYSDVQIGAFLPLVSTTVTYVAVDGSGNTDTCSFNISVVDTVSPVITGCPSPITQNNDIDSCGAVVTWTAPVYYDNSDYFTVTASHASGDYFPVGTTTVTITVSDSSGNSAVCEFDVTVTDNQVPYVVPYNNVSITLGTDGMYSLAVASVDSASYDNCGIANRYLTDSFFNCNDVPSATTWLVVEDIHGNKDSALVNVQVSLPATPVLSVVSTVSDVLCYGDSTGFMQAAVSGGVSPYTFNWSNGSTTFEATNLPIGTYWYEVTDTNGCYTTDTLMMNEPTPLVVSTVKSVYPGGYNVSVNGTSDGSITTTASGGVTPYAFDWNSGAFTTQNLTGVPAGAYALVMTDSNGCVYNLTDTLTEPTALIATATSLQSVICPNDTAGVVLGAASGAVPPYTYSWDFGSTTDYNTGLSYGIYTVTVTDTNGAVATDTVLVDALDYDCDGIYNVDEGGTPNGGGGNGDIDGDGIPNQEDEDSDGDGLLDAEEFDYDNDGVGFDDCDGDGIPNFLDPDLCDLLVPAVFTPNGDGDNDYWEILGIGAFPDNNVQVFNRWGELVYFKEGYNNEFNGRSNTRTQMNGGDGLLPTGTYYYIVKVYETGDTYTGYVYITK